jgi:hypothetical protein
MQGNGTLPESKHPLTADLIATVTAGSRVLLLGIGSGRHLPPLLAAGLKVDVIEEDPARAAAAATRWAGTAGVRVARARYAGGPVPFAFGFDGALATHALLHGSPAAVAAALAAVGNRLRAGAPFNFTLGSTRDPRFGRGRRVDDSTWEAVDGDEAGVPHAYFDAASAAALLSAWEVVGLEERAASAGVWAHAAGSAGFVHWFVRVRRRAQ